MNDLPEDKISGYVKPTTDFFDYDNEDGLMNGNFEVTSCEVFYNTDLDSKWFDKRYEGE